MNTYTLAFVQAALDAAAIYMICSLTAGRGLKWNRESGFWLLWFLCFCALSQVSFQVSEPKTVQYIGLPFENYELLPVDSWLALIALFSVILILNSTFFRLSNMEAVYVTVLSFVIWIMIRLVSIMLVGSFVHYILVDRAVSLAIVFMLLSLPLRNALQAVSGKSFYTKWMLLNSLLVLVFILVTTNFSQALILKNMWPVLMALLFIISLNLWIIHEQRKGLIQENRLTVIEQYLPVIDDLVSEMRANQHEFSNKLLAISGLVETEADISVIKEKVRAYTTYSLPELSGQQLLSIDHKVMAGFLYSKMKLAEWKKMNMKIEVLTDFKGYQSTEYDWIEVLGILIDNAMEASHARDEIKITLLDRGGQLEIKVSNPASYISQGQFIKMFEQGYSSKSSGNGRRGYGLLALKQRTERLNGKILTKNEDMRGENYVTIGVLLP